MAQKSTACMNGRQTAWWLSHIHFPPFCHSQNAYVDKGHNLLNRYFADLPLEQKRQ